MTERDSPSLDVARKRGPQDEVWIDHAVLAEEDYEWVKSVRFLTLWNVKMPPGFLARLPRLWSLDLRGGSATNLSAVRGAKKLQCLIVYQVRGLRDLSVLPELTGLRCLALYGLLQVRTLPSLAPLKRLELAHLGQMRGLKSLKGLLQAPNLGELRFYKKINISSQDVQQIIDHPNIKRFDWDPEAVPNKVWVPVLEKIRLPKAEIIYLGDWFRRKVGYPNKRQ
jgi:hypothetical protein